MKQLAMSDSEVRQNRAREPSITYPARNIQYLFRRDGLTVVDANRRIDKTD
jgi:hypothetical protein